MPVCHSLGTSPKYGPTSRLRSKRFGSSSVRMNAVVVNAPTNELEFLLIHPIGKKHEALLLTKCKPSILNGALIVLGLKPGKNASFVPKKPPPTEAQIKAGVDPMVLVPPSHGIAVKHSSIRFDC